MDQPERCRRTDGKRWRCSKGVIPNEKYCEKHMHRGCQRSRKLADNPGLDLNTSKVSLNLKLKLQPSSDVPSFPSNKTMKENGGENQKIEDSNVRRGKDGSTKIVFKQVSKGKMGREKECKVGKGNESGDEREKAEKISLNEKLSSSLEDDKCSYGKVKVERVRTETSHMNNNNDVVGLDFSPKSVLRDGLGLSRADRKHAQSAEGKVLEPWRCRRTDGKRWRCSKEVIAKDQKYCAKHMHRGAKKRLVNFQDSNCGDKLNPFALVKRANKLIVGFDSSLPA